MYNMISNSCSRYHFKGYRPGDAKVYSIHNMFYCKNYGITMLEISYLYDVISLL